MQNDQLSQVDAGTIETRRNDILISLWKEGCCTRDELKSVLDFNLDTNAGRFTELVMEGKIVAIGKKDGSNIYQLTSLGKQAVIDIVKNMEVNNGF